LKERDLLALLMQRSLQGSRSDEHIFKGALLVGQPAVVHELPPQPLLVSCRTGGSDSNPDKAVAAQYLNAQLAVSL
jgi:hypothetical protein